MTQPPSPYEQDPQGGYGQPQPGYGAPVPDDPGRTLGIIGLVLSFVTTFIGLIVSIIALRKSKRAGFKNTPALVGVIVGSVATVAALIAITIGVVALVGVARTCAELGSGTHQVDGTTYRCT